MRANCSRLEKAKTRLEEELSYEKSKGKKLKKSVDKLESEKRKLLKLNDEVKSESKLSKHELFKIREEKESEKKINEEKKLNDKLEELEKKIQPDDQKQININQIDPNLLEQIVLVDFKEGTFSKRFRKFSADVSSSRFIKQNRNSGQVNFTIPRKI